MTITCPFVAFAVTPSGTVRFLDVVLAGGLEVFDFDSDGEIENQVKLESPEHLEPADFMASEDGLIFLGGFFAKDASAVFQGKHFEAVFDKSGSIRTEISADNEKDVDLKEMPRFGDATAAWDVDGNFYWLRDNKIVVISQDGKIMRRIPFQKAAPNLLPANLTLSGQMLSIQFQKADENNRIQAEYLVLDATNGTTIGHYLPPEETKSGVAVCFSSKSGYTFLGQDRQGLKLITAGLR